MNKVKCSSCEGSRLKKEALFFKIDEKSIKTYQYIPVEEYIATSYGSTRKEEKEKSKGGIDTRKRTVLNLMRKNNDAENTPHPEEYAEILEIRRREIASLKIEETQLNDLIECLEKERDYVAYSEQSFSVRGQIARTSAKIFGNKSAAIKKIYQEMINEAMNTREVARIQIKELIEKVPDIVPE